MNSNASLIMAIPAGVAVSGGAPAALWKPSHQVRSLIQHFAAGVILAALAGTLSFSAAALLYLVTEELLMEAHEVEEKPIATLVLFGGFLTFWGIQLMGR